MLTWSPEEIAGRLNGTGIPSWRTIYRWVKSGVIQGGAKKLLRRKGKGGWYETRGKLGGAGKSIRKRGKEVYKRLEFGHWEADTVVSGLGKSRCCFVTLAERRSRLYLVRKIPSREAKYATEAIISMLSPFPRDLVKTITCDNGKEFAGWRQIEAALGCEMYFADAFCAWQKGTNENTNGLLRQFFPKGYNLSRYNQKCIDEKVELLNNRPRKCIGWKTPKEMILEALSKRCT
jgi:IS30 family transposase